MAFSLQPTVAATSIAFSFILVGNAITQSVMGVPALLVDFPPTTSPDYAARSTLLGRQWPTFWKVGNNFFRPISTLAMLGYVFSTYSAYANGSLNNVTPGTTGVGRADWRLLALSALCHFANIVHSAVNMQPLNDKLEGLSQGGKGVEGKGQGLGEGAVELAQKWITGNYLRIVFPCVAAVAAMVQVVA